MKTRFLLVVALVSHSCERGDAGHVPAELNSLVQRLNECQGQSGAFPSVTDVVVHHRCGADLPQLPVPSTLGFYIETVDGSDFLAGAVISQRGKSQVVQVVQANSSYIVELTELEYARILASFALLRRHGLTTPIHQMIEQHRDTLTRKLE